MTSETTATAAETFTVFCTEVDGRSTVWIGSVEAESSSHAAAAARAECADSWGTDESEVRVMGVARGEVDVVEWDDENCLVAGSVE